MIKNNLFDFSPIDTKIDFNPVGIKGETRRYLLPDQLNPLHSDPIIFSNETKKNYANGNVFQTLNALNTYSGVIVDETGEPIPWATINSKTDATIYTTADDFGNYSIEVPANHIVKISSVGFQPKIIQASQLGTVTLNMDSANQLDEVVIIATKPKTDNTLLFVGLGIASLVAIVSLTKGSALAGGKTCKNRAKCTGLHKNGTLKKGYKFGKGGKVVKVTTRKKTKKGLNAGIVNVSI